MQEINTSANPFPGLRPFESTETHLFFGRDGQSEELLRRLKRTRFLAVVGTSGSGKSSLVRAGLLPALQGGLMASAGSDWRIAILRPGGDPIGNLARALAAPNVLGSQDDERNADMQAVLAETTLRRSSLGLVELVRRARTKLDSQGDPLFPHYENLLVVVDQFEELFRFKQLIEAENSKEDAAAFVKLLLEAIRQRDEKIYVVLTMRSDFLGDCSQFWELPETINNGQYLIPRMTRDERREAITGPVAVGEGAISEPLVNQLLNDVGDNPDQLPILQHALMRTWDYWLNTRRNGEPVDIPHYKAIGGMASALSRHADEAYEELTDEQKVIAEKLFKGLTEKGTDNREIRRPMELQEICELTGASEAEVIAVIEVFRREGRSFLMPPPTDALTGKPVPLTQESLIDISHESLIRNWERLKTWVNDESRSARIYRRLAETAVLYTEGGAGLWRDPDLQLALNWRDESKPNEVWARRYHPSYAEAMNFLNASVEARDAAVLEAERQSKAQIKRARVTALVFGLAFLLACGAVIFANSQRVKANEALKKADEALKEASEQRSEAIKQKEIAEGERRYAVAQAKIANDESERASKEKENAEEQKKIAERKKLEADRQASIAKKYAKKAEIAALQAEEQRQNAVKEVEKNRHLLYTADMNITGQAYETNNIGRGLELLEAHLPTPDRGDTRGYEWFYFWYLYHQGYTTLSKEPSVVNSVAFSPDGKTILTGNADGTVKLRDAATHRELAELKGHTAAISSVAFSPDGQTIATSSADKTVKLWNTASYREPVTFSGHTDVVTSVTFSPDGKMLATTSDDGTVKLWDTASHKELKTLQEPNASLSSVAFSPDGKRLATGSADGKVKLWDTTSYREPVALGEHTKIIRSIAFSPDGKKLASSSAAGTIKMWNLDSRKELMTFRGQTGYVRSVVFSPSGKILAAGSVDRTVKLWDANSYNTLAALKGHTDYINSVAFSPDGKTLASSSADGTVKLWRMFPQQGPAILKGLTNVVNSVAFSPDAKTIAAASLDNTVKLWDTTSHRELGELKGHTDSVSSVAFSPDGKIVATASEDGKVKLWDTASYKEQATLSGQTGAIYSLAYSPDGRTLATGNADGTVKIWDSTSHREITTLKGHTNAIRSVTFSTDSRRLAAGGDDQTVKVWDTTSYKELAKLGGHADTISSVAFSPDGKMVATSSLDNIVKLWSTASYKELATLSGHADAVISVTFSPDGRTLATGSVDKMVKLWDTTLYRELATFKGHTGGVYSVAFSPDGKTLATGSVDRTVRLWHGATDEEVAAQRKWLSSKEQRSPSINQGSPVRNFTVRGQD